MSVISNIASINLSNFLVLSVAHAPYQVNQQDTDIRSIEPPKYHSKLHNNGIRCCNCTVVVVVVVEAVII